MECTSKLRIVYGDYTLGVHGEGFDYIFSYSQGGLDMSGFIAARSLHFGEHLQIMTEEVSFI